MGHHSLDALDRKILSLIAEDARTPFLEVARACNVSGAAIHQRIQKLINLGVIKGSQFVLDPERIGYETCAFIGLHLKDPSDFDRVADQLKMIPEVVECHCSTGGFDLFVSNAGVLRAGSVKELSYKDFQLVTSATSETLRGLSLNQ